MKPYYEQSGVTIYCGDCRDVIEQWEGLRTQTFDLLLTDPPYGIGKDGQKESSGKHGGRKGYTFLGWDAQRPNPELFARLRALTHNQVIWGGNFFADCLPPSMGWLVWDKGQRINQSDGELAWTSYDRALRIYTLNRAALMSDGANHPTQKPEELIGWCLRQCAGKSVLDPFMGSGTTLVVAKRLGWRVVGIEREERYCEVAAERLSQEMLPFRCDEPSISALSEFNLTLL